VFPLQEGEPVSQPNTHIMVVGTTEPQDFQLYNDGEPFDLTGMQSVAIDWSGADPSGTFTVDVLGDPTAGKVRVTGAGVGTLPAGKYPFRFRVTDQAGTIGYLPNRADAIVWWVTAV
jgi:hypothetical protein